MAKLVLEIAVVLLLTLANGLFAMAELALVSARKTRLRQLSDAGDRKAAVALELIEDPDRFLSTIQVGITTIGVLAGAFGGATLATHVAGPLSQVPFLGPFARPISFVLVVLAISYLSLVIGELVPKHIALTEPEKIARYVARPLNALARVAHPAVALLSKSTSSVLFLLGISKSSEPKVTEDDLKRLVEEGAAAGTLEPAESEMVNRVFRLDDLRIDALMTPTSVLVTFCVDDRFETIRKKIKDDFHSCYPVLDSARTAFLGVVRGDELLYKVLQDEDVDLRAILHKPIMVPEFMPVLEILELFKKKRTKVALVVDEYGVVQGLATLTDLLEAVIGDFPGDEGDTQAHFVQRADGSWLVDGIMSIERLKPMFGLDRFPGEEENSFTTLGGFIMRQLGHVPEPGEHFDWNGLRFEVVDRDGNRIDKILISEKPGTDEAKPLSGRHGSASGRTPQELKPSG